ncbi:hypothetical protein XFF6970_270033 [Xanthomonas citri pv. fuscans]|nr:hypothetical protein XFF6970_270033 [Xanthomonas citri pv. fuscans]SOO14118.1 hypothetical protein XFF7766_270021 [Xanthomonas citri pv. fuscans]SOO44259.1 hypothetical protein XFF1815_480021 [Xanthomonas citri pv. fuscans]
MLPTKIEPGSYVRNRPGVCTAAYAEGHANVSRRRKTAHRAWSGRAHNGSSYADAPPFGFDNKSAACQGGAPAPASQQGSEGSGARCCHLRFV